MSTYKERYEERKKTREQKSSYQDRYFARKIESGELDIKAVGEEINERVNTWLTNNNNYFSNAQNRFSGENTSFRNDASDWLSTVQTQKSNFEKEAENIKTTLNLYKSFFGEDYVNSVYAALDGNLKEQEKIISTANSDLEFWSQFNSEDEYNSWYQYRQQIDPVINADDFDEYFSAGEAKKERKKWWSGIENNVAHLRDPANLELYESSANSANGASWGTVENTLLDQLDYKAAKYMTDDEYKVYNYYVGKGDTEKAESFLKSLEGTLTRRQAEKLVTDIKGNALKEAFFAVESGLDQFWSGIGSIDNFIMGTEADIPSATQMASSEIRAGIDGIGGVAYDLAQTTANMFPSILVGAVTGGAGGAITLGTSASGNAYSEMMNLGYEKGQARTYSLLVGASETALSYALGGISKLGGGSQGIFQTVTSKIVPKLDNAIARIAIEIGGNMLDEGLEEAIQEVLDPVFKMVATGEDFEGVDLEQVLYSGLLGALSAGLLEGAPTIIGTAQRSSAAKDIYGTNAQELVSEALEIDPTNSHAQRMQARLDDNKSVSGYQLNRLVEANESSMRENDITAIRSAVEGRLNELGESGNIDAIATALTKQATGEQLTKAEKQTITDSKFGQRAANELDTENIRSGEYSSAWAERIGTDKINAEEYSRLLQDIETESETETVAEAPIEVESDTKKAQSVQPPAETAQTAAITTPDNTGEAQTVSVTENTPITENAAEGEISPSVGTAETKENAVALENASKKYGAQAGAMIGTYAEGQDVAKYDIAYRAAYDMGKSGVNLSYAMQSELTEYLTESQRELAYAAGADASSVSAREQDTANKAKVNGKTGRRKGTVRGDGVTISDIKSAFNDKQGTAYKLLSTYAEATGIDIVLYKSSANAKGELEGAQGKFKWDEDTIYIDINAGLANVSDVNELAKYTMLRTFAHEFTHFIEKWNPVQYNEFRKVVFDTLTERGENVDALIITKMERNASGEMTYDEASREVVAEAMTDILPDANFVEELATKHKTIFNKLLEKLKEFVSDLKAYFNSLGNNPAKEANALKEQVGESVKYVENIVKLFDKVAVEAVENYQMTVAIDEVIEHSAKIESTESINADNNAETVSDTTETVEETAAPAEVATAAPEQSDFEKSFRNATQAERDKVVEAINANTKISHMAPTEIRGEQSTNTEAETTNVDYAAIEESEKEYKKKFSSWLKRANRKYAIHYGGAVFLSDGALGLRATQDMVNQARMEFSGQIYETNIPDPTKNALDRADAQLTEAPLEGTLGDKAVYVFNIDGKEQVFDKKHLLKLDGNLLYIGDYTKDAKIIKAMDAEGNVVGFLLPIKATSAVTNTKQSKLKSFSNKKLSQISKQEVKPNVEETGTVLPHRSDGSGDTRLLAESQAEDVSGDEAERNAVDNAGERGDAAGRDDNRTDAERNERGSGEGSGESRDLRRNDDLTDTNVGDIAAEALHEEVTEQISRQSTEQPKGRNFVIGESLDLPNGEKSRYKANVEAIRLVKQLEAEGRYATEAEQAILSKYVGWGGLANAFDQRKTEWAKEYAELKDLLSDEEYTSARGSTLNAHFTEISVIKAMYDGLASLGFNGGRLLEPSSGVGNFVGAMPAAMTSKVKSWTMVELDGITGLIAKYLYPNADVRIQGFEKANIPDNYMDVAISNVPFGNYAITDKAYPKKVTSAIHNYFFAKSLDKVRPGGIVMFITSSYTMNSKDSTVRRYIMQRADLLGAIRLPDSAFKGNAGTEVVTDILILKKRAANTAYAGEDFLEAPYKYISGYNGAYINSYFDAHPEMVLGTPTMDGGMYRGSSLTYKALEGKGSLADQIREAFSHIEGKMEYPATLSREKTNFAVERANKNTKENGLVVKDGKVYQNRSGELVEVNTAKGAAERISGMLEIRDAAKELMTYQQQGLSESEIKKARTKLNKAYDAFVKKHGYINSQANKNAIKDDPDKFSIFALENYDNETKTATKADIFSKNTVAPNRTVTAAKDVSEGLIVSVNQTGGVDPALIAKLTGKTEADVTRELIDSRQAFKNRDGELEAAEVYLSGNVRAKLRDAEALVPIDGDYRNNVEALKSVIPEDVGYQDIFVNPGTPWIPNSVYSDFAAYMLGTRNTEWRKDIDITRNSETGNFTVELIGRHLKYNAANTQKWGTPRRTFIELFDAMLNSKSVVVKDKLDDGSFVVNKDATAAANEKIENIQKEFSEWLWRDEARRTELATLYNETFNSIVTPKYNGDNLTVNGANALKPLREHQRNAVQRIVSSGGNTLLAHRVGAGKTYEMAAAAMKLKELGLVKKPMFAVPKSLVAQWGVEFMDFFPTAKLLVAEASDFTASNRKVFMNRIANGEYDAVIVSYEQFEKLPISNDFARNLYQEQIDSIVAAIEEAKAEKGGKALSVKDLEKKRKSLQTKIDKLTDKAKDEDNIDFEQLGVDSLFVDEAHNFKNLFYTTSMTNVAGLGNKDGSKRAFDLYTKVRYLQQLNGGRGIVFATATPVMNSMSEMYIMQKYLQPDLLDQLGLSTFDAWAKQFGEVVNGVEIKPSGQGYRVKQSFSRFKNMSELQLLFRNFADVLTDIPGLKIPKMKGGKVNVVVCESGEFQQNFMKELEKRADNIKNVDPSEDNMLKITSDGRKISYTQRMIDPSLPYEEGCKIFRCADNVIKEYNDSKSIKGTQLIFCDMATPKGKSDNSTETEDIETDMESTQLYDDLKARLRQGGIPAKEIAFIHDADTDQKKKKLFADVNDGKVRVLIGSTGKMGVGMNAQKRVVAIHHLDAPWRPGDVEQRDGRAFRQGNINDEVTKYTYVTEGSFDARLWDILDRKQNFINQIMNGESVGRDAEDTGEVTLSAAEVKALASGSPLIMEQVQLDTDIKKLESLYRSHISAIRSAKERLSRDKGKIAELERQIELGSADVAATVDTYSEGKFAITVGKSKYTDKKDAGVALMAEATAKANFDGYTTIGTFAGFELRVVRTNEGINGLLVGKQGYPFKTYPGNTTFMIGHLIGVVESIDEKVKLWQHNLTELQEDIAEQEKLIAAPFAKQTELDQKRARYNEVMEILNPKEEQSLDGVDEHTVQEQSRAYLGEQDASGNYLTAAQSDYFKDSKARDKDKNLLVLYHGTANAGFTVFEPSRGKLGGNWFTTSKKDADSYAGNYKGKLFDPTETDDIRTATGGNYTLGSWMRFDTAEDRAEFLRNNPNAETIKTDAEYDELLEQASKTRDWDEYDRLEEEQSENRAELKKIQRAYGRYEWEHSREATLGEVFENPERFSKSDLIRAYDAYDTNNMARDEEYTKEDLIAGLKAENDRLLEEDGVSLEDLTFKARIPVGESGEIANRANNRTYAVYANVTKPYEINANQKTLAGGNLYPSIAEGLSNAEYDGVIVRNARVGAYQEIGDVVIIKAAEQVKLMSNKTPTADADISYQQRTNTLTDREVLAMAADKLAEGKLTDAERDALAIFQSRLSRLEGLQIDRTEAGRLYKEQQFGANVDRKAAEQTLNRMRVLDEQIKAAETDVLSIENKKVFGDILKKARTVVETEQRAHDAELVKRWRDRTKNAADIKKYRERIQGDVNDLTKWILKPNSKDATKNVPDVLKNSVISFLSSIDFTSKRQLRGGEATKADTEFIKRLNGLQSAIKKSVDVNGLYSGYSDLSPHFMDKLQTIIDGANAIIDKNSGEFVVNQMTSEELKNLSDVVRELKTYITQINKLHVNEMYQHIEEAGDDTIISLSGMESDNGKTGAVSNFVFWQQIRPAYAFERFGDGGKSIYDGLRRGQAQLAFNTQKIVDFAEKTYTEAEVNAWEKEVKNIKLGGNVVRIPTPMIMSFYELSKQKDSLRHILGEGVRVATYTHNGKKISDNGHTLTEDDVKTIIGELSDRQKEVADAMQKYMAQQGGAWGNYVSVKRFGVEMFTNEQYFPINSDGRHLQSTADEHPSEASLYALLNMSFTKSRNEEANNRIVLYSIFDVFANHMASMAQYNAMALPLLDAIKWFNYQQKTEDADGNRYVKNGVREQMTRVYGVPEETRPGAGKQGYAESFVLGILKAFNGTEAQGVPTDSIGMNALRRYNMAQVAYNFRVVVQQPLAISRAALLIDYGSIMKGMKLKPSAIKQNIEEMRKHSGIAAWKSLGFYDVNISRGLTDTIKHSSDWQQKIGEVGMKGAELADTITWAGIWSACKEEVIKKQKLTPNSDGFYEAVTNLFEDIIYKTQVVDSILTKNEYLRSKGLFARLTGSFMSEPTTTASMLIDAVDKYNADLKRGMSKSQAWDNNKHMIGRTMYVYGLTATILSAVQAVADAIRDDDDYETFIEKWLDAFGGNIVDEVMPFNKLPLLSDFYDLAKEFISVFGVDTYGNPPQSVFMQWYDSLVKGTQIVYDKIAGEDTNYTWYGGIYKLLQAAAGMTGLPMAAATREVITVWNNIIGAMAPSLKVKTYDPGEKNEIKYAYTDGYLTFEEAISELLEQGLVDNENEAYFTVSGWEVGNDYSRYDKIYDAILNNGDFEAAMDELTSHGYTEKSVISQITSQIGRWYYDSESSVRISKQQAITMLEKYTDMTNEEITKRVNKWSAVVVTGVKYDDIDDEYMAGNITESRAIEMYMRYGGETEENAKNKVAVLSFVKEHPSVEGISYAAMSAYTEHCEEQGVDVDVFYDVWQYKSSVTSDADNKDNTKKVKVLAYIDSLTLSKKQKNSLYYALGYAKSTIYEAPWR